MQKRILMLATSAFIVAYGTAIASAQQGPMMQGPRRKPSSSRSDHYRAPKLHEPVLKITSMTIAG